jgi:hypothetical protein
MQALRPSAPAGILVRLAIVSLTVATGWIHFNLGGALFALNGVGYFVAAVAMVAPFAIAVRFRWLVRLGLMGYAATAVVAWYLTGPRYDVAYVAKAIEVALIALLALEAWAYDGSPARRVRRVLRPMRGA